MFLQTCVWYYLTYVTTKCFKCSHCSVFIMTYILLMIPSVYTKPSVCKSQISRMTHCCHLSDMKVTAHHTDDLAGDVCRQQTTICSYVSNILFFIFYLFSKELWRTVNVLCCIMFTDHVCVCCKQIIVFDFRCVEFPPKNAPCVIWGSKLTARDVGRITCYTIRLVLMHDRYRTIAPRKVSLFWGSYKSFKILIL